MVGKDNDLFCKKWYEITNKCSFDLIAVTIEECSSQLDATRAVIQDH